MQTRTDRLDEYVNSRHSFVPFLPIRRNASLKETRGSVDSKLRAATRNLARYNFRRKRFDEDAPALRKECFRMQEHHSRIDSYAFIPRMEHQRALFKNICILFILLYFRPAIIVSDRFTVKILHVGFFDTPVICRMFSTQSRSLPFIYIQYLDIVFLLFVK